MNWEIGVSLPAVPVIEVPDLSGLARASHQELMVGMRHWSAHVRSAESVVAAFAGEIDRRSSRDAGYEGLAASTGARGPEGLVSSLTGKSVRDARDLVTVGRLLDAPPVWLTDVAAGVASGEVSVGAAAAIVTGLGAPTPELGADDLLDAAQTLVAEAGQLPPEKVARLAREMRDELDAAGVADREQALRQKRFLRLTPRADGMTSIFGLLDPESAALVTDAIDCVTAPRRNGPRFLDDTERARADAIVNDPRSTEQLALDALVEMIRIAAAADPGRIFGIRKPAVRVHVDARDLQRREGAGHLEGQTAAVSIATVERHACADGYVPIRFESGGAIDVGLTQRLFTTRQRIALAAIWGGCAHPDCDRPPSWCEAHHATEWDNGGPTDIANGILLCRFHHLLTHNMGWNIRPPDRPGGTWLMHPPSRGSGIRKPIELTSKHPLRRKQ
ncbi:HNH endonuclease [Pseudolysinimonas yzui]|uniref:HNH endonuclease n=1 Tax=Pseudolysinimonas yzui TaxID=2708254 RepID=A0A8J3GSS8_9MICO|nr:HNH endonuclease [Pseudolysinimonas yzui]